MKSKRIAPKGLIAKSIEAEDTSSLVDHSRGVAEDPSVKHPILLRQAPIEMFLNNLFLSLPLLRPALPKQYQCSSQGHCECYHQRNEPFSVSHNSPPSKFNRCWRASLE